MTGKVSYIAVDGGGTRCRLAVCNGGTVTKVATGPTNMFSDFDGGMRQILFGLDLLGIEAGLSMEQLFELPAYLGLAGVIDTETADAVAVRLPFPKVVVEEDRAAALTGALGQRDGFVAHCGTGSLFGAQQGAQRRYSGGHGLVLGDEASAAWVGRSALSCCLAVADGLLASSDLIEIITGQLGAASEIVQFAATAGPAEFGSFAPRVTLLAEAGDRNAQRILGHGADYLVETLQGMGWQPPAPICLTGGMGAHYGSYLPAEMQSCLIEPSGDPLDGAMSLARDLATQT